MIYGLHMQTLIKYKMTPYKKVSNFTKKYLAIFFILTFIFVHFYIFERNI